MKIICHRGAWSNIADQNSLNSCARSTLFDGMEIDLRSSYGEIILSHDPLEKGNRYTLLEAIFKKHADTFYALNIKEDGLAPTLKALIDKYGIKNYMCFDLSYPETRIYQRYGLKVYSRISEFEPFETKKVPGIVVDIFEAKNIKKVLNALELIPIKTPLLFISPELHNRAHLKEWKEIKDFLHKQERSTIFLCTDFPLEAQKYFFSPSTK